MFRPDLLAGKRILTTGDGGGLGGHMGRRFVALGAGLALCRPMLRPISTGRW
jgi:NAD(P)-dependent dehydrogenase (short-subunit alcohol dehydrogenase family)